MNSGSWLHQWLSNRQSKPTGALVADLLAMGWHPESARQTVRDFRNHHDGERDAVEIGPDLSHLPSAIDVGDRHVELMMISRRPRAMLFSGFMTPDECKAIRELAEPAMKRSKVHVEDREDEQTSYTRTSNQTWLRHGSHPIVDQLYQRAQRLTRWPTSRMESIQILRYTPGTEFTPHHDYFPTDRKAAANRRAGQRIATLLVYMNTPSKGGSTLFPDADLEFMPKLGCALLFCYERPNADSLTLHAGVPVSEGEKWLCTFFLRDSEPAIAVRRETAGASS